jgi:hypothetical protein
VTIRPEHEEPTMATDSVQQPVTRPEEKGVERAARRMNRAVLYRAFVYVIGLHVFAAFALLLFYAGTHRH